MIIKNINFSYDNILFEKAEIEIPNSGLTAITGESGCGKSTLLKLIYKLIKLNDLVIYDDIQQQNMIFFDQYATLDNDQTIEKAYHFYCELYHRDYNLEKIKSSLKTVNLKIDISKLIKNLSSGQRKRLAIALAIYVNPKLIIFDEPTSSLDYENKMQIMEYLKILSKETAVLISSHDNDIDAYYDRIYRIEDKKINLIKNQLDQSDYVKDQHNEDVKVNYKKLKKYQGKKAKRFILLIIVVLFAILHTASYELVALYYQGKNTDRITEAMTKNLIYYTYEYVDRNQLPTDYEYIGYTDCGAITDSEANEKIKEIDGVENVYPYFQLMSTGYLSRFDDVDSESSQASIESADKKWTVEFDGSEPSPAIVPYYDEDKSLKNKNSNFIDKTTADKLGIEEKDLPAKITIEVGMPVCCTDSNDRIMYYENNKPMDTRYDIQSNEIIYDKKTVTVEVEKIIGTDEYENYYDSNGSGGSIYIKFDQIKNIIQENLTNDIGDRIKLHADLDEKIIDFVPSNYIAFVDSVDNIKKVNKRILDTNKRIITYAPSTTYDEARHLRQGDKQNRLLLNGIYIVIGLVIITILLYRFNRSYIGKMDFYYNIGFKKEQIIQYVQRNIMTIIATCFLFNVIVSTLRTHFDAEMYIYDQTIILAEFIVINLLLSVFVYIYNRFILRRLLHDRT